MTVSLAVLAALFAAGPAQALKIHHLLAKPSACAHQNDADAPFAVQEQAMRCMTNYARRHAGRAKLADAEDLDRSAEMKSRDIVRCDSFSHSACGRHFTYWMHHFG